MKLNLGCGLTAPIGWINIDRSPNLLLDQVRPVKRALGRLGLLSEAHMTSWPRNVFRVNVRKGLAYESGSIEAIYSSHMLEHIYLDEVTPILKECRRVICVGGVMRVALPDGEQWAAGLLAGDDRETGEPGLEFNKHLKAQPFARPSLQSRVVGVFGASPHRWQPTYSLVAKMFKDAGFVDVERREFLTGNLPDISSVEHRRDSLFIEAW